MLTCRWALTGRIQALPCLPHVPRRRLVSAPLSAGQRSSGTCRLQLLVCAAMVEPSPKKAKTEAVETNPIFQRHAVCCVLDYGSQYTQLIARRVRENGVLSVLLPGDASMVSGRSVQPRPLGRRGMGGDLQIYACMHAERRGAGQGQAASHRRRQPCAACCPGRLPTALPSCDCGQHAQECAQCVAINVCLCRHSTCPVTPLMPSPCCLLLACTHACLPADYLGFNPACRSASSRCTPRPSSCRAAPTACTWRVRRACPRAFSSTARRTTSRCWASATACRRGAGGPAGAACCR